MQKYNILLPGYNRGVKTVLKEGLTFAICAYKESVYLEDLVVSLKQQTISCDIFISTSTPNNHISKIAEKYDIPVYINDSGVKGAPSDWNFAYSKAQTKFVTLAHQDDIYEKEYAFHVLKSAKCAKNPIIIFSDYYEIRNEKKITHNKILNVKHKMLLPLRHFQNNRFIRNRILSMGFPICCPAITYNKERTPSVAFKQGWVNSHDWEACARLAKLKGEFVYIHKYLVGHRIYEESQTTNTIASGARAKEDLIILKYYWPDAIAKFILRYYAKSMDSNDL